MYLIIILKYVRNSGIIFEAFFARFLPEFLGFVSLSEIVVTKDSSFSQVIVITSAL